ncbi:MAG: 6-carboxytetrahydropterin synthase [Sphingobacteriales bacterium]|nr:6-carboxytetrahydropterin synthase [Sphingobacteriales bacterium]MCC7223755.1 6-carboxytetrahydropterin synthase [Chitinophagales bacterium]
MPTNDPKSRVRVTKKFSFDMAHALYGYDGDCKNIHGHTYYLSITLIGTPIADTDNVKLGMVIDFSDLKQAVNAAVIDQFDHALVVYQHAPYAHDPLLREHFDRFIVTPFQPTCENLLLHFVALLKDQFLPRCQLVAMRLEETPNSYAEWLLTDNA